MLTEKVSFSAVLQRGNRVQIPKLVRWRFKMDSSQILKMTALATNVWSGPQFFYARMTPDGRLHIPQLQLRQMQSSRPGSLVGYVISVTIEPS